MADDNLRRDPVAPGPRIGIAGAGSVAKALGRLLLQRGEQVVAVTSRDRTRAAEAAAFIGPPVVAVTTAELPQHADRILIAVSDDGILPTAAALADAGMRTGLALHTCGGHGIEVLAPLRAAGVGCGLLHPLQSIRTAEQGVADLPGIAFGIGGDDGAVAWAERIAALLDGRALRLEGTSLGAYHAGAVMASNHLVAVIDAAVRLFQQAGINADAALAALAPLSRTSLGNALEMGPVQALTGPVVRGDAGTVAAHLAALADASPDVGGLYRAASVHLLALARQRGLSESNLSKIESVLESGSAGAPHGSPEGPDH